jgi:hypothetical protein
MLIVIPSQMSGGRRNGGLESINKIMWCRSFNELRKYFNCKENYHWYARQCNHKMAAVGLKLLLNAITNESEIHSEESALKFNGDYGVLR